MKAWASSRRSIARCSSSTSPGTRARRAARGGRLDGGGLEVGHRSEGRREDVGLVLRHPGDRAQEPQDVPASLVLLEVHEPLRDGLLPGLDGGRLLPDDPLPLLEGPLPPLPPRPPSPSASRAARAASSSSEGSRVASSGSGSGSGGGGGSGEGSGGISGSGSGIGSGGIGWASSSRAGRIISKISSGPGSSASSPSIGGAA